MTPAPAVAARNTSTAAEGEGGDTMNLEFLTNKQKLDIILERNTFFFHNEEFEGEWEAYISSIANLLLLLKRQLDAKKSPEDKKQVVVDFIVNRQDGLSAALALSSISEEFFLRLVTFIRTIADKDLNDLVNKDSFPQVPLDKEWSKKYLFKLVRTNREVAGGLVNLLFEGFSLPILREYLPLFELKKLNFSKLDFSVESLIDSIVRHAKRGSYKAQGDNDPAVLIKRWLDKNSIQYKSNTILPDIRRKIDFAIPSGANPRIIIESSYEITTSSAMGDKAKTEMEVAGDIKTHYPEAAFVGFVDGIGWYVRRGDLSRLVSAFDNVFTFKPAFPISNLGHGKVLMVK